MVRALSGLRSRLADPGLFALKNALRVAIVVPSGFAVGDLLLDNQQTATFAAFGGFAMLVFIDFGGPRRVRLGAYLALAGAGVALIAVGTLCSRDAWLAAGAMAVVGFAVRFSGIINGYFAAAGNSALLAFILPLMIPAPASEIPDRLAGWGIAAAASICAVMLLWPRRPRDLLRTSVMDACRALSDAVESASSPDPALRAARSDAPLAAMIRARKRFVATAYRPTGATGPTAALAHLIDDLSWAWPYATPPSGSGSPFPGERAEVEAAVVDVLRASAARLDGAHERPDVERLDPTRDAVAHAFLQRVGEATSARVDGELTPALEEAFRLRSLAYASEVIGVHALAASGERAPDLEHSDGRRLQSAEELAGYASIRSVWLRNSLRGAAGLALAVLVGQLAEVQHAFWVVLGALSVLRSNALSTGATVARSLGGTAIGIVVGGALLLAIGTDDAVLWALLPVASLVAGYAPRVISFAAGQAGFTIAVLILFNLIQPAGWELGLVRVEDVAIGCAISLGVGALLWPRGAGAIMRRSVATAYARGAQYMSAALSGMAGGRDPSELDRVAEQAVAAARQLDDAFRHYLAELPAARMDFGRLATLVSGVTRLWRTGDIMRGRHALPLLDEMRGGSPELAECRRALDAELSAMRAWYLALGTAVAGATRPPAPPPATEVAAGRVLELVRRAVADGDDAEVARGLAIAWATQHLGTMRRLMSHLADSAAGLTEDEGPDGSGGPGA